MKSSQLTIIDENTECIVHSDDNMEVEPDKVEEIMEVDEDDDNNEAEVDENEDEEKEKGKEEEEQEKLEANETFDSESDAPGIKRITTEIAQALPSDNDEGEAESQTENAARISVKSEDESIEEVGNYKKEKLTVIS